MREPPLDRIKDKKSNNLRLVSFNINGFRTVFHYHPWNKLRTLANMFKSFQADIVTLQELKVAHKDINGALAKVEGYHSFITVPSQKRGYSGVGVYVRIPNDDEPDCVRKSLRVIKAEEGITGVLKSHDTRHPYVKNTSNFSIGGYPNLSQDVCAKIDSEGRCIVLEFANNLVVISTYCPANSMGTEEGGHFQLQFLEALFTRIRNLKQMGKEVVLMGDINIARDMIDRADVLSEWFKAGLLVKSDTHFEELNKYHALKFIKSSIPRILLNAMLIDSIDVDSESCLNRVLVDTMRKCQGRKQGLYTVWNTMRNSRPGNYGSRVDYILVTQALANATKDGDIWPFIMGSDHCPIYSDIDVSMLPIVKDESLKVLSTPKLEASHVYKLATRSIDMMFAQAKRKTSSSPDEDTNQPFVKRSKLEDTSKRSKSTPSQITQFFSAKPKQLPQQHDEIISIDSQASVETIPDEPQHSSSSSSSSSFTLSKGKFLLSSDKIPHCKHDCPCILKTARTQENKGRKFWTCPKDKGEITAPEDEEKFSCGFFQWK